MAWEFNGKGAIPRCALSSMRLLVLLTALLASAPLGLLLENHKEDYGSAEQHYRRAIAIDPEHADAHCNLDILLEKRKADCHSAAGQPRPSWCL